MQRAVASEAGLAAKAAVAVQPASLTAQQRASAVQAEAGVRQVQAYLAVGQDLEAMQAAEQVSARDGATLVCCKVRNCSCAPLCKQQSRRLRWPGCCPCVQPDTSLH